jgi:hypothetical protein
MNLFFEEEKNYYLTRKELTLEIFRGHLDLSQGHIGLPPIALPLSYSPCLIENYNI